ncbi:MAG: Unknown protein [uncultured Sulfurovum sp.]|uniref:Uncharacterized protein n=1 Tax=uncultured Sulfurovum sp. TaxID=269237 RepID=A0A6S6U2L4_9BACT|nr:MAG: Unknown protein [uncultured Sulfurovum sp.]
MKHTVIFETQSSCNIKTLNIHVNLLIDLKGPQVRQEG